MEKQSISRKKQYEDYVIVLEADCNPSWSIERFVKSLRLELHDIRSIPSNPKRFTACGSEKICKEIWKKYIKPIKINSRVSITRINIQPLRLYQWFDKSAIDETTKRWRLEGTLELKLKNPLNIPDQDENADILEMLDALNDNIITIKKAFDYYKSYDDEIGIINAKTALDKLQICKLETGVPLTVFFDSTYVQESIALGNGSNSTPKTINFNDFIRAFFRTKRLSGLETGLSAPKLTVNSSSSSSSSSSDNVPLLPPISGATNTDKNDNKENDNDDIEKDNENVENNKNNSCSSGGSSNNRQIDRDAASDLNAMRRSRVERFDTTPTLISSMVGDATWNTDTNIDYNITSNSDDLQMNTSIDNLNTTNNTTIDSSIDGNDNINSHNQDMGGDYNEDEDKDKIKQMLERIQKQMVSSQVRWFENIELQQQQQGLPLSSLVHAQSQDKHKNRVISPTSSSTSSTGVSQAVRPLVPIALNGHRFQCPEAGTPSPYLRQSWDALTNASSSATSSVSISSSQELRGEASNIIGMGLSITEKLSLQQTLTEELRRLKTESITKTEVEPVTKEGEDENEGESKKTLKATTITTAISSSAAALDVDLQDVQKVLTQPQVQLMHLIQFWERVVLFNKALSPISTATTTSTNDKKNDNDVQKIESDVSVVNTNESNEVNNDSSSSRLYRMRRFMQKSFHLLDINSIYGTEATVVESENNQTSTTSTEGNVDEVRINADADTKTRKETLVDRVGAKASTITTNTSNTNTSNTNTSSQENMMDNENEKIVKTAAIFVTDLPVLMSVLRLPASASWWLECYSHAIDIQKKKKRLEAFKKKKETDKMASRDPNEVEIENMTPPSRVSAEAIIDHTNTERLISWDDFKQLLGTIAVEARFECHHLRTRLSESLLNTLTKVAKTKAKSYQNEEEARLQREGMIEEVKLREMGEEERLAFEADRIFMTAESEESKAIRRSMGIFSEILNPFKSKVKMTYEERYEPENDAEDEREEVVATDAEGESQSQECSPQAS